MQRREFITLLGGVVVAWPLAAQAQRPEQMRRVGMRLPATADDVDFQARVAAFHKALALFGWTIGRNVQIDTRWATNNIATFANMRQNWLRLRPTSFWLMAARAWGRCCRRPAPCR
jgi:hypothetical protein